MSANGHYHCAVKAVGRATGRSAVAAAAYRTGADLTDERTGLRHAYNLRRGVVESFIVAPATAPAWAQDRGRLWNECEKASTAKNARLATELELGLPHELTDDQRKVLVAKFAREIADKYKVAVDVAIHAPGEAGDHRNHHAHVMITHRELGPDGFGEIANKRTIDKKVKGQIKSVEIAGAFNKEDIIPTRKAWETAVNGAYQNAGHDIRVDHRSHVDRGMSVEATKHLGPAASGMERRGETSDRGDQNRAITARNAERERLAEERQSLSAAIIDLATERQRRAEDRAERAAVRTGSADRILAAMTERRATFTRAELARVLGQEITDKKERDALATEILAYAAVIGLRETAADPVTRYTTREVLATERGVMRDARSLAEATNGGLTDRQRTKAFKQHGQLDEEQREAFEQLTDKRRLAVLAGEAGTGKTTTLAAVRDAYEGAGHRVTGLASTNIIVQDMQGDGFRDASTIAAQLHRLDNGRDEWNRKTVVVIDEAAMVSTRTLGRVLEHAAKAGAKVILAGDDQQLASIERGGMFSGIRQEHGAAELHTVWRVKDADQKAAYNLMHEGKFRPALDIFDRAGAINWTETQDEARAALVAQWAADSAATPDKRRFVFAYTNADVDSLNADLRAIRRERGELGEDQHLRTKDGAAAFAAGDRIQFTGSAYSRADRQRGLVNGNMGEILEIEGRRVTVELDAKGGKEGRRVTFTVGEDERAGEFNAVRHGYAGTIYKGQGRTLDETYLYHSQHWRAASAYVGLSRHRERTRLYVARDVTRGREPWMMAEGGYDGLDERQQDSAARSYDAWSETNPHAAAKYGLADYVAYVQEQQRERGRTGYDLDQLARQISRTDETRAASQFMADTPQSEGRAQQQAAERVRQRAATGRYAALHAGAGMVAAVWKAAKDALQGAKPEAAPPLSADEIIAAREAQLAAKRQQQQQKQGPQRSRDLEL